MSIVVQFESCKYVNQIYKSSRWVAGRPAANSLEPLPWILITRTAEGRVAGQRRYMWAAFRGRPLSRAQKPSCPLTPCVPRKSAVRARRTASITTAHGRREVLVGTVRQPEGGGQRAGRGHGAGLASGLGQLCAHVRVPLHISAADSSVPLSKWLTPRTSAP